MSIYAGVRIVCAANRNSDGVIIIGLRHFDQVMHKQIKELKLLAEASGAEVDDSYFDFKEQGFICNRYQYHNRQQAWKIASAAGQIIRHVGGNESKGGTLYSENLY